MELCAKEKKCNRGRETMRTEEEAHFKIWRSGKVSRPRHHLTKDLSDRKKVAVGISEGRQIQTK